MIFPFTCLFCFIRARALSTWFLFTKNSQEPQIPSRREMVRSAGVGSAHLNSPTSPLVPHSPHLSPFATRPSPVRHFNTTTTPPFITNRTLRSAEISFVGSPSTAIRSASSPAFTRPN